MGKESAAQKKAKKKWITFGKVTAKIYTKLYHRMYNRLKTREAKIERQSLEIEQLKQDKKDTARLLSRVYSADYN